MATALLLLVFLVAQSQNTQKGNVYVDKNGLMHWSHNDEEVKGFGVNYAVPFAHSYRSAKRMGIDPKEAIDNDLYHFSRLGFDLYRIHVWDTEISDTLGNLIENEHLETFDYLLHELKKRNINYVITPIAYWGNGWPEPDEPTPGFSHKYGKGDCLTNEAAIKAQQNYLYQFLNHVNPYTGVAYKNEPNIIAFEVSNEPHHRGEAEKVTAFVKGMVDAMRRTGCEKPIFYNMSHAVHFTEAYFKGGVQGGTYQWYPTNLLYTKEIPGNVLPNVDDYAINYDHIIKKYGGAKIVYEFDAADVQKSYVYPAMARSFRTAGLQLATYFSYDPTYIAAYNTDYNTHHMNLAYTPQKALALKICSAVFHEVPLNKSFGTYPANTTFDDFMVDYSTDLAVYNSTQQYFYTNHTQQNPKAPSQLKEIAGFGNSPVVQYSGKGAYFLDQLEEGVWRLEVMPDAIQVDNPFTRKNSPERPVTVINWQSHTMQLKLDDLGATFAVKAINETNTYSTTSKNAQFDISPGTYILAKAGKEEQYKANSPFKTGQLNDFYAPKSTVSKPWLVHKPLATASAENELEVRVQYVGMQSPVAIRFAGNLGNQWFNEPMEQVGPYEYRYIMPADKLEAGFMNYNFLVETKLGTFISYPQGKEGLMWDWDYYDQTQYELRIEPSGHPIHLFDAKADASSLVKRWSRRDRLVPRPQAGEAAYHLYADQLFRPDPENEGAKPIHDYSFKHYTLKYTEGRSEDLADKQELVFKGHALTKQPFPLQIAIVLDDGAAYGATIELTPGQESYRLPLSSLKPVKTVTLPRPYPGFLPYYLEHQIEKPFDIRRMESLQFSIGPGLSANRVSEAFGLSIIGVCLE